jgi:hypothetical protein
MFDLAKKIRRSCADDLKAGETVIAGVAGMVVGNAMAEKRAAESQTEQQGTVLDSPAGKAVLGITDRRFLVLGHSTMSGKPKGLNGSVPLDQVASIEFEVAKSVKLGPFVDAFHAVTSR